MKIQNKLFLIFFSFSLLLVTVLVLLMQWSIAEGMVEYVNTKEIEAIEPLVAELVGEYQKTDSWSSLRGENKKFAELVYAELKDSEFLRPLPGFMPPHELINPEHEFAGQPSDFDLHPFEEPGQYVLFDKNDAVVVGIYHKELEYTKRTISLEQSTVGHLAIPKRHKITAAYEYELDFIKQQQSYLWIIALITMILVTLVTLPFARHVVGPIKLIAQGMHQLTHGKYQQQIELQRKDELGELIRDFNELALTLDENENARKRWLANISHELRTPVAILRGELEAMLDNVRPLTMENIGSTNDEVKHLQYLIDDLHQLTSADIGGMHYRKEIEELSSWLKSEFNKYNAYLADAGIQLELKIETGKTKATVFADRTRLCQLFENLINNCVKYAQAGRVKISIALDETSAPPMVIITVEDDGIGVAEQHLENLFEYLYRVDDSRNRKTGGTGLGLSICAHIVAAHHGRISAAQAGMGGLAIIIELPLCK
jgi:two-component system sensor histidine kinase BaeS